MGEEAVPVDGVDLHRHAGEGEALLNPGAVRDAIGDKADSFGRRMGLSLVAEKLDERIVRAVLLAAQAIQAHHAHRRGRLLRERREEGRVREFTLAGGCDDERRPGLDEGRFDVLQQEADLRMIQGGGLDDEGLRLHDGGQSLIREMIVQGLLLFGWFEGVVQTAPFAEGQGAEASGALPVEARGTLFAQGFEQLDIARDHDLRAVIPLELHRLLKGRALADIAPGLSAAQDEPAALIPPGIGAEHDVEAPQRGGLSRGLPHGRVEVVQLSSLGDRVPRDVVSLEPLSGHGAPVARVVTAAGAAQGLVAGRDDDDVRLLEQLRAGNGIEQNAADRADEGIGGEVDKIRAGQEVAVAVHE